MSSMTEATVVYITWSIGDLILYICYDASSALSGLLSVNNSVDVVTVVVVFPEL